MLGSKLLQTPAAAGIRAGHEWLVSLSHRQRTALVEVRPNQSSYRTTAQQHCTICCSIASTFHQYSEESSQRCAAQKFGKQDQHCCKALVGIAAAIVAFMQQATPPEFRGQGKGAVKGAIKTFRMASVVLPFASMGMGGTVFLMTKAVGSFMKSYLLLLFLRVLLSWFPAFNWERQPWLTLRQMTDPYLQLFRGLIPPLLGMIDFTPLLGFFILQWLSGLLQGITMEDEVEGYW